MEKETERMELERLITRAEQHRLALGLSHIKFATRYSEFIGSHKTWEFRLLARNWDQLKAITWLPKLRAFVAQIDGAAAEQEIFGTLPIVKHADYLFEMLQSRTTDRRCAMLVGVQGTGKTMALRHVQRVNRFSPVFISANETWKDSRMRISIALAQAIHSPIAPSAAATFQNCLDALKSNPLTLLIDEAHEGGVLLMKLVKTIINDTQARVMLAVYPTAWGRLINGASDAYAEAQQLLRRTWRPVKHDWISGIGAKDLEAWGKAVGLPGLKARSGELLGRINKHGNFSLLADALERARFLADDNGESLSEDSFIDQVNQLCGLTTAAKNEE